MPNEELEQQQVEPQQQPVPEADNKDKAFVEPTDISEAFETLREIKQVAAETPVEQPAEPSGQQEYVPGPADTEPEYGYVPPVYDEGGSEPGGDASGFEDVDYGAFSKEIVDEITRAAAAEATRAFREQGIQKFNVNMLYNRDENTGTVTFDNPDNPNMPFTSRKEAQDWCDAINNDIDNEWRKMAGQKRSEYLQASMPTMRLLQFAPEWNKMSKTEKDYFDDLIETSAIVNEQGQVIGYNCDLNAMAEQARRMASKYGARQAQQQQQRTPAPPSGPATDMRSSGSAAQGKQEITDPKDLAEAMKMLKQK